MNLINIFELACFIVILVTIEIDRMRKTIRLNAALNRVQCDDTMCVNGFSSMRTTFERLSNTKRNFRTKKTL